MDKEISNRDQTKGTVKNILRYVIFAVLIVGAVLGIRKFLVTSAEAKDFIIATVETGAMENTLTASGLVVPSFEREINAPVSTEIKKVYLSPGAEVNKGDLILELDQEYTRLEFERLDDELELRKNNIDKLKLKFDKDLRDLDYQDQIKALQVEELMAEVQDQKRLLDIGGATSEELEKAELNLKVSQIQKKMLENELEYSRSVNTTEKKSLELEYQIQKKRLAELNRKLRETKVRAPQAGVITWINEDIGKTVAEGETILKLANLGNYEIQASSSDRNTQKIKVGLPAKVRIGTQYITGEIERILPTVENNTVKFIVKLTDPNVEILRPNMRCEVRLVTDKKDSVLRVRNGVALSRSINPDVFFVQGNKAFKRRISKGLVSRDYVEVMGDVKAGDRIIISDTEDYEHLDQFTIKK